MEKSGISKTAIIKTIVRLLFFIFYNNNIYF